MLYRVAQTLQHAFLPKPSITSSVFGLSTFSLCRTSFLGRRGIADSTPRPSQSPQGLDEAQLDEERRRAGNEYRRAWLRKKKEDPVWLEQYRKSDRERKAHWRQEQNKDEASRERFLIRQREAYTRWVQIQRKDEVTWEKHLERKITHNRNVLRKIKEDPAKLQSFRTRTHGYWRQQADTFAFKRRQSFKTWFSVHKDHLDTFTWKRWRPVFLTESVDKVCATCRTRNRRGQRRLWFIRKSDPELWDCMTCFVSSDVSDIVPVEGADRFYKGRYLHPQPTATEDTVDYKDTVEVVDRKEKNDDIRIQEEEHLRADKDKGADGKTAGV